MRDLSGLLFPKSVAVVGASQNPDTVNHAIFKNVTSGFPGPIYAVNPKYQEVLGRPCFPRLEDLPEPVDLVVIAIPARLVNQVLVSCGKLGIKNIVVISAGFKEAGEEGARREQELVRIAREYDLNVLGPNCFGLISTRVGLNTTFAPRGAQPGDVAFMSQSGAFCSSVLDWAWEEGLGFSQFVSLGNKAVLNEVDFLQAFAADPQTEVIVAYLEGIADGPRFLEVAREVTRTKPVVILKSGRYEAGARAVSSHTGTLAGSDEAYQAAFRKCGVIRAYSVEELFDYAYTLAKQPLPQGRRVGIVTNAGGAGVMATDAVEREGLEVARFSPATSRRLSEGLPPAASVYNPVDILGDAPPERYRRALELVAGDENVDLLVALSAPHPLLSFRELAEILAQARRDSQKPLVCSFMAGELGEEAEALLEEAGIPSFFDPARAVRSLRALVDYAELRRRPRQPPRQFPVDRATARKIIETAWEEGRPRLGVEAQRLLACYGIPVAKGGLARTPKQAGELAQKLGEKVVLKVVSPDIVHKSDVGGVRVGVPAREAEREAWRMLERLRQRLPEAELRGLWVQELLPPGQEVIVGVVRDPIFGPLIMFGLGGVYVEVLKDVAFGVAPLSPSEAQELIQSIRAFPILRGVRGVPGVDLGGLAEVLERVARLAVDLPEIMELDINPLMCYPDRVVAVDLRLTVSKEET
jgi:acetyltransferase